MAYQKLTDALKDLEQQRAALDSAIAHLKQAIDSMGNVENMVPLTPAEHSGLSNGTAQSIKRHVRSGSHFDDAYSVLTKIAGPLHITDLLKYVEKKSGKGLTRASLEGAISRHLRTRGDRSLIVRVGPSTYATRRIQETTIPQAEHRAVD